MWLMNTDNDQNSTPGDPGESYLDLVNTMGGVDTNSSDADLNETSIPDNNGERVELGIEGTSDGSSRQ